MTHLAAELPCIIGVLCATYLMSADKPWWMWGSVLAFAFLNIVSNHRVSK